MPQNADTDTLTFEACRSQMMEELCADATRRFGYERTKALHASLVALAEDLAKVALFPLGADDRPGFFIRGRD